VPVSVLFHKSETEIGIRAHRRGNGGNAAAAAAPSGGGGGTFYAKRGTFRARAVKPLFFLLYWGLQNGRDPFRNRGERMAEELRRHQWFKSLISVKTLDFSGIAAQLDGLAAGVNYKCYN